MENETTIDLEQEIERKLDELEKQFPTSDPNSSLSREGRRYSLWTIADMEETPEAKVKAVREALMGEVAQVSMF
ncbi:hypothetical protein [Bifidobacterium callitrichidarum]|uniref:Uncharacterized protein n=1 Tax=Bifidobacterium callitrichidarum TaxID=2052941 RepID=A0A2U2N980_9BIFI|nr:hypothetical protein [Bifidobacterium callitrichidarum]PWG65569.1 hypothetical protein DF196_06440 [Bifidobacterium callitrichidarum]